MTVIEPPLAWRLSINQPPEKVHHAAAAEIDDDLVVLHAVTTLHRAEIPQKAIVTIAHPSQSEVLEHTQNSSSRTNPKPTRNEVPLRTVLGDSNH
jgi:hypothetical protein